MFGDGTDGQSESKIEHSFGWDSKASIMCSVWFSVQVLILDEPSSGLDIQSKRNLWNFLLVGFGIPFYGKKSYTRI